MGTFNSIFNMDPQAMLEGAGDMKDRVKELLLEPSRKQSVLPLPRLPEDGSSQSRCATDLPRTPLPRERRTPKRPKPSASLPCATADSTPHPTLHVHPSRKR